MSETVKLTKRARVALEWMRANEPVSWFPIGHHEAPTERMWKRLARDGLIAAPQAATNSVSIKAYSVTPAGRAALEAGR